jgi:sulfoxide reductase heme-binding subunit YedZ
MPLLSPSPKRLNIVFRIVVHTSALYISIAQVYAIYAQSIGINPFAQRIEHSGRWAIIYLLLTLTMTPLRRWLRLLCSSLKLSYGKRLSDWNCFIQGRRALGLWSFFFLCWHAQTYLSLEIDFDWVFFWEDLRDRLFLSLGLLGFLISFALALTSPRPVQRLLGKNWRKLHRSVYLLAVLAVAHIVLENKVGEHEGWIYAFITVFLLSYRMAVSFVKSWRRSDDTGMEHSRQPGNNKP